MTRVPDGTPRSSGICRLNRDEIRKPTFDANDAVEFWERTNRQDWELSERAQEGISSKGYRPGPYSNREELLLALDRFVLDRVST